MPHSTIHVRGILSHYYDKIFNLVVLDFHGEGPPTYIAGGNKIPITQFKTREFILV